MLIDIKSYIGELEFFEKTAGFIFQKESAARFSSLLEELRQALDNKREKFDWSTPHYLHTRIATNYDGPGKKMAPVYLSLGFTSSLSKVATKGTDWRVTRMETQLKVVSAENDTRLLHLHVDKKQAEQFGPEIHMQVSEHYLEEVVGVRLAVPRIPFGFLLPTDILDFALSEFFSVEWSQAQAGAFRIRQTIEAQSGRVARLMEEISKNIGRKPNNTPINLMQNCTIADLRLA